MDLANGLGRVGVSCYDRRRRSPRTQRHGWSMKNFARVIRLALRYRLTLAGLFFSSLMVALFWGGNIGGLYPIVEVAIRGKSLQTGWPTRSPGRKPRRPDAGGNPASGKADPPAGGAAADETKREIELLNKRLQAEQAALATAGWLKPYIHRYLPADPFQTIVWIVVVPDGRHGRQGLLHLCQQHVGRTRRANGVVRSPQAVVPSPAADGSGRVRRAADRDDHEPLQRRPGVSVQRIELSARPSRLGAPERLGVPARRGLCLLAAAAVFACCWRRWPRFSSARWRVPSSGPIAGRWRRTPS